MYLGCPIGGKFPATNELKFLLDKVRKLVNHWSSHLLSMQGQVVILCHVLRAVPIYHLMEMTLNKEGFDGLESVCRESIWEPGEQGHPKISLVAWDVITQLLLDGVWQFYSFRNMLND